MVTKQAYVADTDDQARREAEPHERWYLDSFARSWHILMKGSIISAAEGDVEAAPRGKAMARFLIDQFR